ncbi:MAG: hypothetical protein WA234_05160 [Rectinemataceae bacterium]
MNNIIENLKNSSTTVQAFGVTAGGLIGVFATLAFFFFLIWVANKISSKKN